MEALPHEAISTPREKSRWHGLRLAGLITLFALLGAGLLVGGFLIGQSTRDSAATVKQKLADQATKDHAQASAALKAQSNRLNDKVLRVADVARANGYSSGQSAGYQSGVSDGTAQGFNQGYDEGNADGYSDGSYDGYSEGFDEGTCHDPITYEYVC
ncbi:MAG TPA: hypothetical protein VH501_05000 [Solirubrobacterales bacterium]